MEVDKTHYSTGGGPAAHHEQRLIQSKAHSASRTQLSSLWTGSAHEDRSEDDRTADLTSSDSSSSPFRNNNSRSPFEAEARKMAMGTISGPNEDMDSPNHSNATTVASDEGESDKEEAGKADQSRLLSTAKAKGGLFFGRNGDGDESDDASEDENDDQGDGLAFLARFRQKQAQKLAVGQPECQEDGGRLFASNNSSSLSEEPSSSKALGEDSASDRPHPSSIFSGTLSDPPSSTSRLDADSGDASLKPKVRKSKKLVLSDGDDSDRESGSLPSQSPRRLLLRQDSDLNNSQSDAADSQRGLRYLSEAQKQRVTDQSREKRTQKLKDMASRLRQDSEKALLSDEDIPSSGAEDDVDGSAASSSTSQLSTQKVSGRSKSRAGAKKQSHKALDMSLDAEDHAEMQVAARNSSTKRPAPLSKKEQDEMKRMQARIEREKKTSLAKTAHVPRERKTFGIKDLLANIGAGESSRRGLALRRESDAEVKADEQAGSPSSDPIENSSDVEDGLAASKKTAGTAAKPNRHTDKPFYIRIKEKFPIDGYSDEIEDADSAAGSMSKEASDKWKRLQEAKRAALRDITKAQSAEEQRARVAELEAHVVQDEDDLEFYDEASETSARMLKPAADDDIALGSSPLVKTRPNGSPNKMLSPDANDHSQRDEAYTTDTPVSMSQIHRAGRALGKGRGLFDQETATSSAKAEGPKSDGTQRAKPSRKGEDLSKQSLETLMMQSIARQNMQMRQKKEQLYGKKHTQRGQSPEGEGSSPQRLQNMLDNLRKDVEGATNDARLSEDDDDDDDEYNPDAGQESEIDLGSGNEDESENEGQDSESDAEKSDRNEGMEDVEGAHASVPPSPENVKAKKVNKLRTIVDDDEDDEEMKDERSVAVVFTSSVEQNDDTMTEGAAPAEKALPLLKETTEADFGEFFAPTPEADDTAKEDNATDDAFGQFFEDTQPNAPLRGESFSVLPRRMDNGSPQLGFTQLFEQGTPNVSEDRTLMPPPVTSAKGLSLIHGSDHDGFAALRKAQAEYAAILDDEPFDLPALEDVLRPEQENDLMALEMEAIRAEEEERHAKMMREQADNNMTYINKHGFFTQTRPDSYSNAFSQSQSQSQAINADTSPVFASQQLEGEDERSPGQVRSARRKRFRRAASESIEDEEPRRNSIDIEEESVPLAGSPEHVKTVKSAFEVMRKAADKISNQVETRGDDGIARRRFIEGEAEESDDESQDGNGKRKKKSERGGLEGVFSDDDGDSEDEREDDEEDDGRDLEGLINEEKEEDEGEKDVLARERFQRDMDEDDKAALALHERAARGAFRNKRRARNHVDGTLEGFLEEDFEDDWLEKVARNPYGNIAKKRRLDGGKDEMDLLAEKEDSQAFVREYRDTHTDSIEMNAYNFLIANEDEGEEDDESPAVLQDLHSIPSGNLQRDSDDEDQSGNEEDEDESNAISSHRITRKQIQEAVAARRRARRRQAILHGVDDDEVEAEEERKRLEREQERERELQKNIERALYNMSDDEEEEVEQVGLVVRSTKSVSHHESQSLQESVHDEEETTTAFGLSISHKVVSTREKERLVRLAKDYEHEPDWKSAREAIQRNRHTAVRKVTASSRQSSSASNEAVATATGNARINSRLQGVLSRESQFSG